MHFQRKNLSEILKQKVGLNAGWGKVVANLNGVEWML